MARVQDNIIWRMMGLRKKNLHHSSGTSFCIVSQGHFFGSVRTYKKIIAFKSHRGNWLVLNKRLEKDYNDGIFINTFKRTNHMRQIISHQIHPIKTNGKVSKNSGQMCWIWFMSFLLESAQLSLFNISSWSMHIWSSFSYSRKHDSIKISTVT